MTVERLMPSLEAEELIALTHEVCTRMLDGRAAEAERSETFPRDVFRVLGEIGILGLPYESEHGGSDQPYEVFLQVVEVIAAAWASVAVGVSVHTLACLPIARFGTLAQREQWLPWMLGGETLGAYCLSEAHAGSDPAAMRTTAKRVDGGFVLSGAKAWTTHGGQADFYTVMARTSAAAKDGVSCFFVTADSPGLTAGRPERKLGLTASTTATMTFDDVFVPEERLIGNLGDGLKIAFTALDAGRLGIAAVATGLGQASLDVAVEYAHSRETFGQPIIDHEGLAFLLADMDASIESARATYLAAARVKDKGADYSRQASVAKLVATDNVMRVTTDAVQVLGGAGYTRDFPVERYMREAKVMQIFEGTNQIQRLIISRHLARAARRSTEIPSSVGPRP